MKKLISAVSSLAMAATMVGAAVPFATGAADASATLEVRPFVNKDGSAVSTTITQEQIAAGDVTIPVGVYVVKESSDIKSMQAQMAIDSKDGNATPEYVTFSGVAADMPYGPKDTYFTTDYAYTADIATNMLVGPMGSVSAGRRGVEVVSDGTSAFSIDKGYKEAGVTNYWSSIAWIAPNDGCEWTGAKSDDYPLYVVDVNFAKGTPAGTYTIDFCEYGAPENDNNRSCNINTFDGTDFNKKVGNLELKPLTITIEGDVATTTSNEATTTTTTATTTAPVTTTTTTTQGEQPQLGDYNFIFPKDNIDDLIAANDEMHIEDNGDGTLTYYMDVAVDVPDTDLVAAIKLTPGSMSVPAGVTYDGFEVTSYATSMKAGWEKTGDYLYLKTLKGGSEPDYLIEDEPIITLRFVVDKDFEGTVPVTMDAGIVCVQLEDENHTKVEHDATIVAGSFTKGSAAETTTSTEEVTTTTSKETTTTTNEVTTTTTSKVTTTTTTTTAEPGTLLYGDTNCNGVVNIADVVVLNKWLNDASSYAMKDQGKINADCCDAKGGEGLDASDSKAIIQSIVHLVKLPCAASDLK
jgi:hypothetical protein